MSLTAALAAAKSMHGLPVDAPLRLFSAADASPIIARPAETEAESLSESQARTEASPSASRVQQLLRPGFSFASEPPPVLVDAAHTRFAFLLQSGSAEASAAVGAGAGPFSRRGYARGASLLAPPASPCGHQEVVAAAACRRCKGHPVVIVAHPPPPVAALTAPVFDSLFAPFEADQFQVIRLERKGRVGLYVLRVLLCSTCARSHACAHACV